MANPFNVSILSIREVHTLDGIWDTAALKSLLELADADEIGEIADEDLLEISLMVLQDLGVQKAGELVLEAVFGDSMRPGVRQNLVDDLQEDQPWNDFAEVGQQRGIFVAVCLLQKAFPTRYGTPDATELRLRVHANTTPGRAAIDAVRVEWLIRLLACGMNENNIVHRLYGDGLREGAFIEAKGLIWDSEVVEDSTDDDSTRTFDVTASSQLFASLSAGQSFTAAVP